jgi:ankyrin repeat protein
MIDFFVANDIDIDNKNKNGETALHLAAKSGDVELLKYLILKCNADINIKNNLGDSVQQ